MSSYVIGVVKNGKEISHYRIFSIVQRNNTATHTVRAYTPAELCAIFQTRPDAKMVNCEYSRADNKIQITQGSINAYPVFNTDGALVSKHGLTVTYSVQDSNGVTKGFGVVDEFGQTFNLSTGKLINMANRLLCTNWEVYTKKDGTQSIRAKTGTFPIVTLNTIGNVERIHSGRDSEEEVKRKEAHNKAVQERQKQYEEEHKQEIEEANNQYKKDMETIRTLEEARTGKKVSIEVNGEELESAIISLRSETYLPTIKVSGFDDHVDLSDAMKKTAGEKMMYLKVNLRNLAPYYASMFDAIPKTPTVHIPTMAVTENHMYYNPLFLSTLSDGEATFIIIHEMLHIVLQHSYRHGKKNNYIWNIACDLFINEMICNEFDIKFGGPPKVVEIQSKLGGGTSVVSKNYKATIACPKFGVFLSSIGESIDFSKQTAESLYMKLYKENKAALDLKQKENSGVDTTERVPDGIGNNIHNSANNAPKHQQEESGASGGGGKSVSVDELVNTINTIEKAINERNAPKVEEGINKVKELFDILKAQLPDTKTNSANADEMRKLLEANGQTSSQSDELSDSLVEVDFGIENIEKGIATMESVLDQLKRESVV